MARRIIEHFEGTLAAKNYSRLAQKSPRLGEKRMMSGARLDEVSVLRALLQRVFLLTRTSATAESSGEV